MVRVQRGGTTTAGFEVAVATWALDRIDSTGRVAIQQLATELGFSRKHLHDRFAREVGLSPKRALSASSSATRNAGTSDIGRLPRPVRRLGARRDVQRGEGLDDVRGVRHSGRVDDGLVRADDGALHGAVEVLNELRLA